MTHPAAQALGRAKADVIDNATVQVVTFELFEEIFALPILDVREIIRMTDITPVPQAPEFVEGVINLRGQIIPIVDLRARFGLESQERDDNTCIIVVEVTSTTVVGLIVDRVHQVDQLPASTILPAPSLVAGAIGAEYIKGISNHDDKMIIHIDMQRIFNTEEIDALEGNAA